MQSEPNVLQTENEADWSASVSINGCGMREW